MILIQARAGGRPRTKGSMKGICTRDRLHTVHMREEVEQSKAWRMVVARALREAQIAQYGKLLAHEGPVEVRLVFTFPRKQALSGGNVPSHNTEWPIHISMGDADKLARNVLDALSVPRERDQMPFCSALIKDDSQVVLLNVGKFWVPEGMEPGVQIVVSDVAPAEVELEVAMGRARI